MENAGQPHVNFESFKWWRRLRQKERRNDEIHLRLAVSKGGTGVVIREAGAFAFRLIVEKCKLARLDDR